MTVKLFVKKKNKRVNARRNDTDIMPCCDKVVASTDKECPIVVLNISVLWAVDVLVRQRVSLLSL